MIRFALIVASTLGFFLTAALGNLMVPLLRAFRMEQNKIPERDRDTRQKPDEDPEPKPQVPTMGGLCLMVGTHSVEECILECAYLTDRNIAHQTVCTAV